MTSQNNFTKNILVIKLGALGDFVQALGPMAAIRAAHKNDHITLLTTAPFKDLAEKSGYFNDIWLDERPKWHDLKGWLLLRHRLNKRDFARVYDLQNNDRTAFYFKLFSKKDKPEWVGIAKGASHRNTSPERTASLAFYGHVQTLGLAGIHNINIDNLSWLGTDQNFELPESYALLVPGSAPSRPEKRWPAANYAALAQQLIAQNITPVILGTNAEADVANAIEKDANGTINLAGKTGLYDIPVLARRAKLCVGNDTGPMHMIAPTGCPSVVLFSGDSQPHRHAPLGPQVITVQQQNIDDIRPAEIMEKISAFL